MKLPRYSERSTVSELGSVRAISPEEAAATAGAKYGAVQAGLAAVGEVFTEVAAVEREMDIASDKVQNAVDDAYMEQALDQAKREAEELSLSDPTWTRSNYEANVEAIVSARTGAIDGLKYERGKDSAHEIHKANAQLIKSNARLDALDIEANRINTNWTTSYNQAVADKRYEDAYKLLDVGADTTSGTPIIDPTKEPAIRAKLDALVTKQEVDDVVNEITNAYFLDQEKGDELYREVQSSEKDPEKKAAILSGLNTSFANVNRALKREKEKEESGYIIYEQNLEEKIKSGVSVDLMSELKEGNLGEEGTKASANRYARLRDAQVAGVKVNQAALDFSEKLLNGDPMPSTDTYRAQTDAFIETIPVPEDSTLDAEKVKFYKGISLVGQEDKDNLKGGIHSIAGLVKMGPLFAALTDDPLNEPDIGINEKERAVYELNQQLLSYGIPPDQAAEDTLKRVRIDKDTKLERSDKWRDGELVAFTGDTSESGEQRAAASYADVIDSDKYDMPGFFNVEAPGYESYLDYQGMFRNAFMQTGDWDVAERTANRQFKEAYNANNLNSEDGDDYEITVGPIRGDATKIKAKMLGTLDIETQKYLIRDDDGSSFYPSKLDPAGIRFENPRRDGDDWLYTVMYNGTALPKTANTTVDVRLEPSDLADIKAFTEKEEKVKGLNAAIERNEKHIETIARHPTASDPFMLPPYKPDLKKSLEGEIKMYQKDVAAAEEEFKQRYPKF